jgi:hypothetical protein
VFGIALLSNALDEFTRWRRLADGHRTLEGVKSVKTGAPVAAPLARYGFGQPLRHALIKDVFARRP